MLLAPAPSVIRPAFLSTPPSAVGSRGDDIAELAVQLGQDVGEEERIALRALTPIKADGTPAGLAACIIAGRRNVKSWAMEMALIDDAFVLDVGRCVWTAHLFSTTAETFRHLLQLIEGYDWLRRRVQKVRLANGEEGFDLLGGRRIDFIARQSGRSGRGQDIDRLVLDEWLYGSATMLGAMVPAMGASKAPYIRYGSSPGLPSSAALRDLRARGRAWVDGPEGRRRLPPDPSLSYVEWTSETETEQGTVRPPCASPECDHARDRPGCALDREDVRRSANPAYGRRLRPEFVAQERAELPPTEFGRERAGWWEDPPPDEADEVDDTLAGWDDCKDANAAPGDPVVLGVDVAHNGRSASIVACGRGADGVPVVEVVDFRRSGTGWVAGRLAELVERHKPLAVGVVKGSPADGLRLDGVTVLSYGDAAGACAGFARAVQDGQLRHRGQATMAIAVASAVRVLSGDVWRWSRRLSKADISPLWAAVVALHLLATAEPPEAPYDPLANFMPNL